MIFATTALLAALTLAQECQQCKACPAQQATTLTSMPSDIVDTAVAAGSFNTLVTAVKAAELVEVLKGEGPFTVFAPADSAFAKIPGKKLDALIQDKKALTSVLTYHVVPGRLMAKDVLGQQWLKTVNGQSLLVRKDEKGAMIDGARIVQTDIACSNGVIHVIDTVVQPRPNAVETAVSNGSFKTLVAAVKAAGLVETLSGEGPFTIFAPTDEAFAAIPEADLKALLADKEKLTAILTYHVVPGRVLSTDLKVSKEAAMVKTVQGGSLSVLKGEDGVRVNGAKVVLADLVVGNGVIHVVDSVILPKSTDP